jgi:hypothetical protein
VVALVRGSTAAVLPERTLPRSAPAGARSADAKPELAAEAEHDEDEVRLIMALSLT